MSGEERIIVEGEIHQRYRYSTGVVGERFFRELRDRGRMIGSRCIPCGRVLVPPRLFCDRCFGRMDDWAPVGDTGTIYTFTVSYLGISAERLTEPEIYAIVNLDGADSGLYHMIGEVKNPEKLKIGMKVKAVYRDRKERTGSILDIKYFKPLEDV
ncbi:MAG: Zn-ribbon domain-containing OB-fold protein [bacterium]